jgi:two-component system chemotaxis response regulator CheY
MRSVVKRTLKAAGYVSAQFHEAANGGEALELMKNNWIDIIMTDYNMPVMNGLDFIRAVKKDDLFKDIPVIVVSTEGHEDKIRKFMEAGAAGYVTKPFAPEQIRDLIVNILGEVNYEENLDDSNDDLDF